MDAAAAASRRAKPNRGRPLVPPNYVSLRDLQELRLKEKEEERRREEEEAAARRAREEQRKHQEEEEEAAARRFVEERRRREEEAAAARRARDSAAVPRPEMRASSSSSTSSFVRNSERARGGQRLVVVADRPPPPPPRGKGTAMNSCAATGDSRGKKGPDGGGVSALVGGGGKAPNGEKVSPGTIAGPGHPAKPAAASSHAGKAEENRKGEDSGCQGKSLLGAMPARTSSASGEVAKVDIASSYRGPVRPRHWHQGKKKGFDGRNTGTSMTSSIGEAVEVPTLPVVNLENKGKSRPGDWSNEAASASMPLKANEPSPPQDVKLDNKGKKKPFGGRHAGAAPSSDLLDGKVEASGFEGTTSVVSSSPDEQANASGASYRMPLRSMYMRTMKKELGGRSTETDATNVASKATDASLLGGVNLEIKENKGLIEQGTGTALARMPIEAGNTTLARGFKSENRGKKEISGGRRANMAVMKAQPCLVAEGNDSHMSSGGQGTTWDTKTESFQAKQTVVEVNIQPNLAAESSSYLKSSSDQGMIQAAKSEGSEEKKHAVEMRTATQLKPGNMRNSGRQRPGGHSRVNVTARQHGMVWVPKAAAVLDSAEAGKFP